MFMMPDAADKQRQAGDEQAMMAIVLVC